VFNRVCKPDNRPFLESFGQKCCRNTDKPTSDLSGRLSDYVLLSGRITPGVLRPYLTHAGTKGMLLLLFLLNPYISLTESLQQHVPYEIQLCTSR